MVIQTKEVTMQGNSPMPSEITSFYPTSVCHVVCVSTVTLMLLHLL